jgi:hypothetical protein
VLPPYHLLGKNYHTWLLVTSGDQAVNNMVMM